MKIYYETKLSHFRFQGMSKDKAYYLTEDDFDTIEEMLEKRYPDGVEEDYVNDLLTTYEDMVAQWLGYDSFDEIINRNNKDFLSNKDMDSLADDVVSYIEEEFNGEVHRDEIDNMIEFVLMAFGKDEYLSNYTLLDVITDKIRDNIKIIK